MKTQQPSNDIRRRLDFGSEENKPKRQTTNIHMFLNQHQQKPRSNQSDTNLLMHTKNVNSPVSQDKTTTQDKTSPRNKDNTTMQTDQDNTEQKYAGGGYSKSPNPKSLGRPSIKVSSPQKNTNTIGCTTSTSPTQSNNVLRFDAESFFKSVNVTRTQSNMK